MVGLHGTCSVESRRTAKAIPRDVPAQMSAIQKLLKMPPATAGGVLNKENEGGRP
jgi:hypothetical protein